MAAIVLFNGQATTCTSQITASQTSITGATTATWSPTGDYFLRIDGTAPGTTTAIFEIVRVTSNNQPTGTFVCTRAQGSTSGQAFAANATLTPILDATAANAAFVRLDSTSTQAMAAPLTIAPGTGLSVPTTSFGSYPVKIDDILVGTDTRYPSATAQITFLNTTASGTNVLPTGFRHLKIIYYAREDGAAASDFMTMRFNNDGTANYDTGRQLFSGTASVVPVESLGTSNPWVGLLSGATATANYFAQGEITIAHYAGTVGNKEAQAESVVKTTNLTGGQIQMKSLAGWRTTGTAITRIDLFPGTGNFIAGSLFTLYGLP